MSSINRKLANLITSTGDVATSALDNAASMQVFSSSDSLPTSGLSAGDQALVGTRLYISNGSGWYNVALINATPRLTLSSDGSIALATDGATATTITLTAADSDNSDANLTLTAESGGDFFKMATVSQDSSVFTITPRSLDSATSLGDDGSSSLTFKASDGINFATQSVTFTLSFFTLNSRYTKLLVKANAVSAGQEWGEDPPKDNSSLNATFTKEGGVKSSAFTPYHPGGYSVNFDGTGDNLVFDMGTTIGTSDFTIEGWIRASANEHRGIFQISGNTNGITTSDFGNTLGLLFRKDLDGTNYGWQWYGHGNAADASGGGGTADTDLTDIVIGKWYHFAYVKTSGNGKVYINGVQVLTASDSTNYSTLRYVSIGATYSSSYYWKGQIRDFRVVIGTAIYTSAFTPPTTKLTAVTNTKLLTCHLPYIADGSTTAATPTINGNSHTVREGPYDNGEYTKDTHGGSHRFDGTNDYLSLPNNAQYAVGSNAFTLEGWAYPNAIEDNSLFFGYYETGSNQRSYGIMQTQTTSHFAIVTSTDGTYQSANLVDSNVDVANYVKTWVHLALVKSGTTITLYLNGKSIATSSSAPASLFAPTSGTFRFGDWTNAYGFEGFLSDVRLVNGTAVYSGNFTPPTSRLANITNTKILAMHNDQTIYDIATRHDVHTDQGEQVLRFYGDAVTNATTRKFTTSQSVYCNGGDYFHCDLGQVVGTQSVTLEGWFYPQTGSTGMFQLTATDNFGIQANATRNLGVAYHTDWLMYAAGAQHNSGVTRTLNTWYHVALVRNAANNTTKLYINGTEIDSTSDSTNYTGERHLAVGAYYSASYTYVGYWQDFRVTYGLARYTSNFTPPTAEFKG